MPLSFQVEERNVQEQFSQIQLRITFEHVTEKWRKRQWESWQWQRPNWEYHWTHGVVYWYCLTISWQKSDQTEVNAINSVSCTWHLFKRVCFRMRWFVNNGYMLVGFQAACCTQKHFETGEDIRDREISVYGFSLLTPVPWVSGIKVTAGAKGRERWMEVLYNT